MEKRRKWYAIAGPAGGVFGGEDRPEQHAAIEVSSREEGQLLLEGGIHLEPGLYAFTDAGGTGGQGIGIVVVHVASRDAEPDVVRREATSIQAVSASGLLGHVSREELMDVFVRMKHIVGEMVALHTALRLITSLPEGGRGSKVTVVHDYIGVCAWMLASTPAGAAIDIDPGFSDGATIAETWRPTSDPTIKQVVAATWDVILMNDLIVRFRHQPGHRSEAAGKHHYVRFNRMADELAKDGSEA